MTAEDQIWESFFEGIQKARPSLDGHVPVGVILAPIERVKGEQADISIDERMLMIWHESISHHLIGEILKILVDTYKSKSAQ